MVKAELITMSTLDPRVLNDLNKLVGYDVTKGVRTSNRVQSEPGKILSYYRAMQDSNADIDDVDHLLKLVHFGFLVAGSDYDIMDVQAWCSLPQINTPADIRGITACIFAGTGEQWKTVLTHCCSKAATVNAQEFGVQVHNQFRRLNFKLGKFEVESNRLVLK